MRMRGHRPQAAAGRSGNGRRRRNDTMMRLVLNLVLTGLALALLGILVLLSTTADDEVRRSFDQSMRQLRELGLAVERDTLNARNLNVDQSQPLASLATELRGAVTTVGHDLTVL